MKGPFSFKRKLIHWLYNQVEAEKAAAFANRAWNAKIAPSACIFPEAIIENFYSKPENMQIGDNTYVRGRLITYGHGGCIIIGDWSYIGTRTEIWSMDSIIIGNRVMIAHDVNIHDGTAHSQNAVERHEHFKHIIQKGHPQTWEDMPGVKSAPIVIEDDVWISFGVTILKGVRIGNRSIIAAGSVVMHDVPPDMLYRCQVTPIIEPLS